MSTPPVAMLMMEVGAAARQQLTVVDMFARHNCSMSSIEEIEAWLRPMGCDGTARVVDEHVDGTEGLDRSCDRSVRLRQVGEIRLDSCRSTSEGLDFGNH